MKKINCGGFYINEDNFEITDDGELKLKSGGDSGASVMLVELTVEEIGADKIKLTSTKTCEELIDENIIIFYTSTPKRSEYFLCVGKSRPNAFGVSFEFTIPWNRGSGYVILSSTFANDFPASTASTASTVAD